MKVLPSEIVADHITTLRDARHPEKHSLKDILILYLAPVGVGVLGALYGTPTPDVASLLAAVAVLTGLIFNLSFHVFDKSIQMRNDPFQSADDNAIGLVDELQSNVNYTILVGIVLTGVLTSMTLFEAPRNLGILVAISTGIVSATMIHMLLMCGMILKRFKSLHAAMKP
ncbi:hypothetical protein [Corynebacterium callunae]|uniref:hypothetical protein n=1 Tax=Corynebacterium callunae TaxID=1721 RepID=UPI001FFE76C6|nr:hypothetical protein [Corynebacterium callunae]MCK2200165.1 hypothetical protein [Corynebacterium callunae]